MNTQRQIGMILASNTKQYKVNSFSVNIDGVLDEEEEWTRKRAKVEQWARKLMQTNDWVVLDIETPEQFTDEIVQIAIVSPDGNPLLNTLVKPTKEIPDYYNKNHGISEWMLDNSPNFEQIYPEIKSIFESKKVITYNAVYDWGLLNKCSSLYNLERLKCKPSKKDGKPQPICAMKTYAQWYGKWNPDHANYTWQRLMGGNHTAYDDCLALLRCIAKMAGCCWWDEKQKRKKEYEKPVKFNINNQTKEITAIQEELLSRFNRELLNQFNFDDIIKIVNQSLSSKNEYAALNLLIGMRRVWGESGDEWQEQIMKYQLSGKIEGNGNLKLEPELIDKLISSHKQCGGWWNWYRKKKHPYFTWD